MGVLNTKPRAADPRENGLRQLTLLAAIIDSSEDAIVSKDLDGVVTSWNHGAERLYGYSAEEIIGQPMSLLAHHSRPDEMTMTLARIRSGERVQHYETVRVTKGGELVSISLTEAPIYDAAGALVGASAIARDNTERHLAEGKALELSLYARTLIEASLDPLVTIRADGKIMDVNEATIHVTGVERERLIGTDFSDYFTEPAMAGAGYREAFSEGSVTDYPLTIRHRDGHLTDVLYNATLYKDADGKPLVTGIEFYHQLASVFPEQAEGIVFLTGGAFTASARTFLDEVTNVRMDKPFDVQNLRALVNDRVR